MFYQEVIKLREYVPKLSLIRPGIESMGNTLCYLDRFMVLDGTPDFKEQNCLRSVTDYELPLSSHRQPTKREQSCVPLSSDFHREKE